MWMHKHPGRPRGKGTDMMTHSETDQTATEIPVACTLTAEERAAWSAGTGKTIFYGYSETRELPDGYALRFPGDGHWAQILLDFIVHERGCCLFFAFRLDFEPNNGAIWLHLSGSADAKAFATEMIEASR
jgi:hypothetical protein